MHTAAFKLLPLQLKSIGCVTILSLKILHKYLQFFMVSFHFPEIFHFVCDPVFKSNGVCVCSFTHVTSLNGTFANNMQCKSVYVFAVHTHYIDKQIRPCYVKNQHTCLQNLHTIKHACMCYAFRILSRRQMLHICIDIHILLKCQPPKYFRKRRQNELNSIATHTHIQSRNIHTKSIEALKWEAKNGEQVPCEERVCKRIEWDREKRDLEIRGKRAHIKKKERRIKYLEKFEYCVSGSLITLWDGLVENFLANANSDMNFYFADIHFSLLYFLSPSLSFSFFICFCDAVFRRLPFFFFVKEIRRNSFGYFFVFLLKQFCLFFHFLTFYFFLYHRKYKKKSGIYTIPHNWNTPVLWTKIN